MKEGKIKSEKEGQTSDSLTHAAFKKQCIGMDNGERKQTLDSQGVRREMGVGWGRQGWVGWTT